MPFVAAVAALVLTGAAQLSAQEAAASRPASRPAGVELIGTASFPGNARDRSGLSDLLEDGTPHDRLGSHGSAIAYAGSGNRYFMLADRGPGNGATSFKTRFHECEIVVDPSAAPRVRLALLKTTLLVDEAGRNLVGKASAFDRRFDPEGIRVSARGTLFISDEYGPVIAEFGLDGIRRRLLPVPADYAVAVQSADPKEEHARNKRGRAPNKGFEGLAITPDGKRLYALPQAPLLQDGGKDARNCRMLEIDLATEATREIVVQLAASTHGFNELLAVDDRTLLAIEEDALAGKAARFKKIVRFDLVPSAGGKLPAKSEFLDLLDPAFGLAGASFPQKVEGLAFGPDLPDGRHLLLVTTDNDFAESAPTWVWAFAIPGQLFAGTGGSQAVKIR